MFGGGKKCPRCGKSVYHAEEQIGAGQTWHKSCFTCRQCNKRLDSTTLAEHDGEIFCKACHGRSFGPKGYGYGGGAGALHNTGCGPAHVNDQVNPAARPAVSSGGGASSKFCCNCGTTLDGGAFCCNCGTPVGGGGNTSAAPQSAPVRNLALGGGGGGLKLGGGSDKCGACGKTVYHAEKAIGAGGVWHKSCFKCMACGKALDSNTMKERESQIYCSGCYAKNFGPKGYGYGGGAGALHHTQ